MMSKAERENVSALEATIAGLRLELSNLKTNSAAELDKAKKETEQARSSADMWMRSSQKAEQELESAHSLLDGLPQAPAAETEAKESYQRKPIPLTTRLANWIAKVAFSEAFSKIGIK